jgi:uncharacterized protein YjiS (DUF1127 family)
MSATTTLRHVRSARPRTSVRGALDYLAALDARFRAREHLGRLDDRALADVNMSRADVMAELRRSFWA